MKLRKKATLAATSIGLLSGAAMVWIGTAVASPDTQDFEVNSHGKSVGDIQLGSKQMPDLVPVRLEDGSTGYARAEDLMGKAGRAPINPEEAVAMMKERVEDTGMFEEDNKLYVPGYADDGKTVIGRVLVGSADGGLTED